MSDCGISNEEQLRNWLNQIDTDYQALNNRMSLAYFNQLIGEPFEDMVTINSEISTIMLNKQNHNIADEWKEKTIPSRLKRHLEILTQNFIKAGVDNDELLFKRLQPLQKTIIEFKPEIDGKTISRSERNRILENEPDRDLRKNAYFAGKKLDDCIESSVLGLMSERNRLAKNMGYEDYVQLGLEGQELTEKELIVLFESIRDQTAEAWETALEDLRKTMDIVEIMPWDLSFYQEKILPAPDNRCFPKDRIIDIFRVVLKDVGGDFGLLPIQVVICDIPYGGLCIPVTLGEDIRILSNPHDGFMSYDTLFHEFGHGIQSSGLGGISPIVAGGDPPFFWEGIAGVYEHLMQSKSVLSKHFNLDNKAIKQIQYRSRFFRMNWFRNIAVTCQVEWAAYRGEKNLRGIMQELNRLYLGYDLPKNVGWAGNTLYTTHPLYNQNYLMMDVMSQQTISALKKHFQEYPSEHLFDFINEKYIKPAGWISWREKIVNATGMDLSADALGRYLVGDEV